MDGARRRGTERRDVSRLYEMLRLQEKMYGMHMRRDLNLRIGIYGSLRGYSIST